MGARTGEDLLVRDSLWGLLPEARGRILALEEVLAVGGSYLPDMVSLRVTDELLSRPDCLRRFSRFAGPRFSADLRDLAQYYPGVRFA